MKTRRALGYWIVAHDEASALDAVRMAGLPVLLMGFNGLFQALLILARGTFDGLGVSILAVVSLALMVTAFRLRGGRAGWVPPLVLLFVAIFALNLVSAYLFWYSGVIGPLEGIPMVARWIIPTICLILMLAGFRGWRWLRANGAGITY